MPYIGKHGKRHPIFDLVLMGAKGTKRVRSYRFRTLRVFQEEQVQNEPGFYTQRLAASFPGTLAKSQFGFSLNEGELEERTKQLSRWAEELLRVRGAMSPRLRRATLQLLQLDEAQLFPEALSLGRQAPVPAGASSAPAPEGSYEVVEVAISKGPTGLGLDLVPLPNGAVIVAIVSPARGGGGGGTEGRT